MSKYVQGKKLDSAKNFGFNDRAATYVIRIFLIRNELECYETLTLTSFLLFTIFEVQ